MDRYLNNFTPSIREVQEWGYDVDLYFIEQDEDLALHSPEYIPILMELASDKECPKKEYCLSILTHYSQILLANRMLNEIKDIKLHIENYDLSLKAPHFQYVSKVEYLSYRAE